VGIMKDGVVTALQYVATIPPLKKLVTQIRGSQSHAL